MTRDEIPVASQPASLERLIEQYHNRLLAVVRRRIGPALAVRIDAEDVLQEAYLAAFRKWERYLADPRIGPFSWLYRIVYDCIYAAQRREKRHCRNYGVQVQLPVRSSMQLVMNLVGPITTPSKRAGRREERERIRRLLDCLRPEDREILWMRHYDDLSHREIGEVLGITENAATVRYARAMRKLHDLWSRIEGGEDPRP